MTFEKYKHLAEKEYIKDNYLKSYSYYKKCLNLCRKGTVNHNQILSCIDDVTDSLIRENLSNDLLELTETIKSITDENKNQTNNSR